VDTFLGGLRTHPPRRTETVRPRIRPRALPR